MVSTPVKGDFMFDNSYVIEVGGASKNFPQLSDMPYGTLVKEGITQGSSGVLPMWMIGLLKVK